MRTSSTKDIEREIAEREAELADCLQTACMDCHQRWPGFPVFLWEMDIRIELIGCRFS